MMKFGLRTVALGALALGLSLGGSDARADLTLDVLSGTSGTGPEININSTTGSATLTHEAANTTYTFQINGSNVVFNTDLNGAATVGPGAFTANNLVVDFAATGASGLSTFDSYKVSDINVTQTSVPLGLTDVTTDVSGTTAGVTAPNLTITPGTVFSGAAGTVGVISNLAATAFGSGTVTFQSTVNNVNVPGSALSLNAVGFTSGSGSVVVPASYSASNQIVISGLMGTQTDSITATTMIATPEPSTMAAALLGLAAVGGYRLRRRRGA